MAVPGTRPPRRKRLRSPALETIRAIRGRLYRYYYHKMGEYRRNARKLARQLALEAVRELGLHPRYVRPLARDIYRYILRSAKRGVLYTPRFREPDWWRRRRFGRYNVFIRKLLERREAMARWADVRVQLSRARATAAALSLLERYGAQYLEALARLSEASRRKLSPEAFLSYIQGLASELRDYVVRRYMRMWASARYAFEVDVGEAEVVYNELWNMNPSAAYSIHVAVVGWNYRGTGYRREYKTYLVYEGRLLDMPPEAFVAALNSVLDRIGQDFEELEMVKVQFRRRG